MRPILWMQSPSRRLEFWQLLDMKLIQNGSHSRRLGRLSKPFRQNNMDLKGKGCYERTFILLLNLCRLINVDLEAKLQGMCYFIILPWLVVDIFSRCADHRQKQEIQANSSLSYLCFYGWNQKCKRQIFRYKLFLCKNALFSLVT